MNKCLICGYNELSEQPYVDDVASYEICPCCGFQYGLDDDHKEKSKEALILEWRNKWIDGGCVWFSKSILKSKSLDK